MRANLNAVVAVWVAITFILSFSPSSPVLAQNSLLATTRWIVDEGDIDCRLIRAGGDQPIFLRVTHFPLGPQVHVSLGNRTWTEEPSKGVKNLDVILQPSGKTFSGPSMSGRAEQGALLQVNNIDNRFLDVLSESHGIAIEANGTRLIEMSFTAAEKAVREFRRCGPRVIAALGMDPAAVAALKQKAVPTKGFIDVRIDDYPEEAIRSGKQGIVIARYEVGADGRVRNCIPLSKPDESLIRATCNAIRRTRFKPAIGADGHPVSSQQVSRVIWSLPGSKYPLTDGAF